LGKSLPLGRKRKRLYEKRSRQRLQLPTRKRKTGVGQFRRGTILHSRVGGAAKSGHPIPTDFRRYKLNPTDTRKEAIALMNSEMGVSQMELGGPKKLRCSKNANKKRTGKVLLVHGSSLSKGKEDRKKGHLGLESQGRDNENERIELVGTIRLQPSCERERKNVLASGTRSRARTF